MNDALTETRPGRALGLLVTNHFETVDRALWAFFNLVDESPVDQDAFTRQVARAARNTTNLFVKKFFILSGLCLFEEMRQHYRRSSPNDEKFDAWIQHLKKAFDSLFFGELKQGSVDLKNPQALDAKYPNVELFCVKVIAFYLTM
jgi:truncated hemoglobin YjbI